MAERRMFCKSIVDSDAFLDMPASAQALYFHIGMRADDDGFLNSPKRVMRMVGASEDDLKLLLLKRFLLSFKSGVVVVKHWRMNNTIRKDRSTPTVYQEEFRSLVIKENGAYTERERYCFQAEENQSELTCQPYVNQVTTTCQPNVNQVAPQIRLDKNRLDKNSLEESRLIGKALSGKSCFIIPTLKEVDAYVKENGLHINPQRFIDYYDANGWMVGSAHMNNWQSMVKLWESNEKNKPASCNPQTIDMDALADAINRI